MASVTPFVAGEEQVPPADPMSSSDEDKEPAVTASWTRRVAAGFAACIAIYAVGRATSHGLAVDNSAAPLDTLDSIQLNGGEWGGHLDAWVTSEGDCYAAIMASSSDGAPHSTAPVADNKGWDSVYADAHEEECHGKKTTIHEDGDQLKQLFDHGRPPKCGIWFAGKKYFLVQFQKEFELNEETYKVALLSNRFRGGAIAASTGQNIVVGFHSADKGQSAGKCKAAVLDFTEYLKGLGY